MLMSPHISLHCNETSHWHPSHWTEKTRKSHLEAEQKFKALTFETQNCKNPEFSTLSENLFFFFFLNKH